MWLDDFIKSNEQWLDIATPFPVAFSQVREDVRIDSYLASYLNKPSLSGIMIASGGCSATVLASLGIFSDLTMVDMNPAQLALTKLKLHLLENGDPSLRLKVLGHHEMTTQGRAVYLQDFCKRYAYDTDIFGDFSVVSEIGPDYCGRYELLFHRLQSRLQEIRSSIDLLIHMDNPLLQMKYLDDHPHMVEVMEKEFTNVFSLSNLVRLFGIEATQNAIRPFSHHFFHQALMVLRRLPAASNPYLCQFLTSKFSRIPYDWLMLDQQPLHTTLQYICGSMEQALQASEQKYDFIHLSNILDWLSPEEAKNLLTLSAQALRKEGVIVIRQLNSHLDMTKLYPNLAWQEDLSQKLHGQDRSFFYQKLYVARK